MNRKLLISFVSFALMLLVAAPLLAASKEKATGPGLYHIGANDPKLSPIEEGAVNAAQRCDAEALKLILAKGVSPNLKVDGTGNLLLTKALTMNNFNLCHDAIATLINAGTDLNYVNKLGYSLTWMISDNSTTPMDIFYLMKEKKANFGFERKCSKKDSMCIPKTTVLMDLAEKYGTNNALGLLIRKLMTNQDAYNQISFIAKNSNINAKNSKGQTAMHLAAQKGYIYTVTVLLQLGADKGSKDNKGQTPVDAAFSSGNSDLIKLFN